MLQILLLYAYAASIYNQDHEQLNLCLVVNFTGHTKIKEINTILETVPVWPAVRYISDTGQYRCTISDLPLFFTILYKVIFLITQYITLAPFYMYIYIYFFFYGVINFYHNSLYDKLWGVKEIVSVCGFTFSSLTTLHTTNYDKNCLKCCNISIVLNIKLLQYQGNMAIHIHYISHHLGLKAKAKKKW